MAEIRSYITMAILEHQLMANQLDSYFVITEQTSFAFSSAWPRPKLNTKVTLNHQPRPTTRSLLEGSRLSKRLRFDMQAFFQANELTPIQLSPPNPPSAHLLRGGGLTSIVLCPPSIGNPTLVDRGNNSAISPQHMSWTNIRLIKIKINDLDILVCLKLPLLHFGFFGFLYTPLYQC